jgi:twitching motility protein PilT
MTHPKLLAFFKATFEKNASDLILSVGAYPSLKINGEVFPVEGEELLTQKEAEEYFLSLLTPEQKEEFERTREQDFSISVPEVGRFRVNLFVQKRGLAGVFRPIPTHIKSFEELGLPNILQKISHFKNGLVLITGTVGSGKTTTLASMTEEINRTERKHIITIEDPIEFSFDNKQSIIEQREVGEHTESFKKALRQALREAPDVIYIGEMRDIETISLAITAAETGILVLATLHTAGAVKAVDRMIDAFPAEQQSQVRIQIAESLKAVVWQQLVKTVDGTKRVAALEVMI